MKKTKRGNTDHETLIFKDLKNILKSIFEIKKIEKRTIHRYDIEYDLFVSIDKIKPGLKGYEFFDFLFHKKVLIGELKTPGQYFDFSVMAQVQDIKASYLNHLKLKKQFKLIEFNRTLILTVVTSISDKFIKESMEIGEVLKPVKGKKGLYIVRGMIDIYILVIDNLEYNKAYAELFKYVTNLKRLASLIPKMKDGLKKEKFIQVLASIIDYKPEILTSIERRTRDMIPVFTDEKDRIDYIHRFFKGFGKENIVKELTPKDMLKELTPKDMLKELTPKDMLKELTPKDIIKSLSKKDKAELKKILLDIEE